MAPITAQDIKRIAQHMNSLSSEEAASIVGEMRAEQPAAFQYLVTVGEGTINDDERQWLVFLGVTVWRIVKESGLNPPAMTAEILDRAAKNTSGLISYLKGENSKEAADDFLKVLKDYPQPFLLNYVIGALNVAFEDEHCVRKENMTVLFFFVKILIDCLAVCAPAGGEEKKA